MTIDTQEPEQVKQQGGNEAGEKGLQARPCSHSSYQGGCVLKAILSIDIVSTLVDPLTDFRALSKDTDTTIWGDVAGKKGLQTRLCSLSSHQGGCSLSVKSNLLLAPVNVVRKTFCQSFNCLSSSKIPIRQAGGGGDVSPLRRIPTTAAAAVKDLPDLPKNASKGGRRRKKRDGAAVVCLHSSSSGSVVEPCRLGRAEC